MALDAVTVFRQAVLIQPTLSKLQACHISLARQRQYLNVIEALLTWMLQRALPVLSTSQWDVILLDRVEYMFDRGLPKALASRTIAALPWISPALRGVPRFVFPLTTADMQGWDKKEPRKKRPPLPYLVSKAIAMS